MRMLLVAHEGPARDAFIGALAQFSVECDVAATPEDLLVAVRHARYSGVLFDVPTIIREKTFDKRLLHALGEVYPSVRLRYDVTTHVIYTLGAGVGSGVPDGLSVFVAACRDFLPRSLRRGVRVDVRLPVLLWSVPPDDSNAGECSCTINISYLGCFAFSARSWTMGQTLWAVFPDVTSEAVSCRVAWHEPWGFRRVMPGVGLTFLSMPEALHAELGRLGCEPDALDIASAAKGL